MFQNSLRRAECQTRHRWLALAGCIIAGALGLPAHGQCMYDVLEIPQIPINPPCDWREGRWRAINNHGMVAGGYEECGDVEPTPVMWSAETGLIFPELPPGVLYAQIEGINDTGDICGRAFLTGMDDLDGAFVRIDDTWHLLAPPTGATHIRANAINNHGVVTGYWGNPGVGFWCDFVWADGRLQGIEDCPRDLSFQVESISDSGFRAGVYAFPSPPEPLHPAIVEPNGAVATLPLPVWATAGVARDVNEAGVAVGLFGVVQIPGGAYAEAFVYEAGRVTLVPPPGNWTEAKASRINRFGDVVGEYDASGSPPAGWLMRGDSISLLSDLTRLANVESVVDLSDTGLILANTDGPVALLAPITTAGDITRDCVVDENDLNAVLGDWGTAVVASDLNQDGIVGAADLAIVLAAWTR